MAFVAQKYKKPSNAQKESDFQTEIALLFVIASGDERLNKIDEEKLIFLENQRKPERLGFIYNVQTIYDENLTTEEINFILERRKERQRERETSNINDIVELVGSTSESSQNISLISSFSQENFKPGPSEPKKPRSRINVINEKLVATFDKCLVSDRNAVRIIIAVAEELGYDSSTIVANKTSIHNYRKLIREKQAIKIKDTFPSSKLQAAVLHWDGKILKDNNLPIIISEGDTEKILSIPKLEDGTGITQANAIAEVLQEWGLSNSIKTICCDTTGSNLGVKKGAAVILERILEKDFLYTPCRHHIFEIVLGGVFDSLMPSSTGPEILLFKRFQPNWPNINQQNYLIGVENDEISNALENIIEDLQESLLKTLNLDKQPRDDYRELLILCLIFIGKIHPEQVKFYKPGAVSRARWMAKAIYCLKIFIFCKEFRLTPTENKSLIQICIFIVRIHVKAWFSAPFANAATNFDFNFIKDLIEYRKINPAVSEVALKKFSNHTWYLSPEFSATAFFDQSVSVEIKQKMVANVKNVKQDVENKDKVKRLYVPQNNFSSLLDKDVDFLISPQSMNFFKRFELDSSFLDIHLTEWNLNESFKAGFSLVRKLKVINDVAERGIKLITEFNNRLTHDDNQKQCIIQLIENYNKKHPDVKKAL